MHIVQGRMFQVDSGASQSHPQSSLPPYLHHVNTYVNQTMQVKGQHSPALSSWGWARRHGLSPLSLTVSYNPGNIISFSRWMGLKISCWEFMCIRLQDIQALSARRIHNEAAPYFRRQRLVSSGDFLQVCETCDQAWSDNSDSRWPLATCGPWVSK